MKKRLAILFVLCMMFSLIPMQAFAAQKDTVAPYAAASISGGLVYNTTKNAYYMVGECIGVEEYKTLVVALYKQSGSDWVFVDSEITCGTSSRLTIEKEVSITNGYYKLVVSATTPTTSGSHPYYYTV